MNIEDLKLQADKLGISYHPNIGLEKLQEKINSYIKKQEEDKITEMASQKRVNNRIKPKTDPKVSKRQRIIRNATKRSLVIINSNDPKDHELTTCVSGVRNSYFGSTKVLPLGKEWWLEQMHIDNLRSIPMTKFIKNNEGNSKAVLAKKFTVEILDTDEEAYKARLSKLAKS